MNISINGKTEEIPHKSTVAEIISLKKLDALHVVVEVNQEIVKRNYWDTYALNENDQIELLSLVGGG